MTSFAITAWFLPHLWILVPLGIGMTGLLIYLLTRKSEVFMGDSNMPMSAHSHGLHQQVN